MTALLPMLPRLSAVALLLAFAPGAISARQRPVPAVPEAPPPIIDPIPGPFIVGYDLDGKLTGDADGIIANAARSWMVAGLDTYTVCYQPRTDERALQNGFTALESVALQLKAYGAATVVTSPGGQCSPDWSVRSAPLPYVYIMGSVRL
ncbi:hypothetical protein [Sphingomonas panni]|uniref:hypothetical protein n=1 Tax=Sphingomonas panni TaxID=237612 RepID=UPI001F5B9BA7|nr:hypothetical protein [Sphingomonas panni]